MNRSLRKKKKNESVKDLERVEEVRKKKKTGVDGFPYFLIASWSDGEGIAGIL